MVLESRSVEFVWLVTEWQEMWTPETDLFSFFDSTITENLLG